MTPEQQRIAIAEACGWTFHPPTYNEPPFSMDFKCDALLCWVRPGGNAWQTESPPDYLNDLNAMHEAEKVLNYPQRQRFITELYLLVGRPNSPVFATAAQRAEAFLRTLNLWKD